jgi:hypothetical protein
MLPETKIIIEKNGSSRIEGQQKSDSCFKLSDLGRMAGKVVSDEDKEHTPLFQDVNQERK